MAFERFSAREFYFFYVKQSYDRFSENAIYLKVAHCNLFRYLHAAPFTTDTQIIIKS